MTRMADEREETEVLSVLRDIWAVRRQGTVDVAAAPSNAKVCKNMKDIGFGGLDAGLADSTAGPVDGDLRSAWRARLAREGKIAAGSMSVRDLVLGDQDR